MTKATEQDTPELVTYLRSLQAVRDRSKLVFDLARAGEVDHWIWHEEKLDEVVQYCMDIIERDFGTDYSKIPRMLVSEHHGLRGSPRPRRTGTPAHRSCIRGVERPES